MTMPAATLPVALPASPDWSHLWDEAVSRLAPASPDPHGLWPALVILAAVLALPIRPAGHVIGRASPRH